MIKLIKSHLQRLLDKREMTQADLKRRTGIRNETLGAYRYGYINRINKEDLNKICKALNCKIGELLEYIPDDETSSPK